MNKCFSDSNCENEHVGHGDMLHAVKGFDAPQGLVCILDRVFDRGRQSLDDFYGYEYVSVESSSISELHAFSRPAVAEWKWILYQQQALPSDLLTPIKSMDRYAQNMVVDLDNNVKGDVRKAPAELSFASVLSAASKVEKCPHARIRKLGRVRMIQPLESNASVLSLKGSLSWRAANSKDFTPTIPQRGRAYSEICELPSLTASGEEFAAAITHKDDAHVENYDLPPLMSSLKWGEDWGANGCAGFHEGEPVSLVEGKLTATMLSDIPDLTTSCELLPGVMEPSAIPTILEQPFVEDRSAYFDDETILWKASNEKCFDAKKHEDEILGEALCHAQTRARLAEKLAAQAWQDRERLAHLLLREAWTTCTYKQRAQTLELENRLLRLCSNVNLWRGSESMYLVEQRARTSWKPAQKHCTRPDKKNLRVSTLRQDKVGNSWRKRVVLSCTLGLAFVLGLSIAGAGLLIGWSMGWMLFS